MVLFQNDPLRSWSTSMAPLGSRQPVPSSPPMDAYRRGDDVWVHLDLPGTSPDSIEINLERNVLTVSANRDWVVEGDDRVYVNERPRGRFWRQVHLGDGLDAERVEADYHAGVLSLRIPISERAKPRKIEIGTRVDPIEAISAAS